jgi:hypothetical protein
LTGACCTVPAPSTALRITRRKLTTPTPRPIHHACGTLSDTHALFHPGTPTRACMRSAASYGTRGGEWELTARAACGCVAGRLAAAYCCRSASSWENPEYGTDDCRLCGPADGSWKGTSASGDSKVTDEGLRAAERGLPALTSKRYNTPVGAEKLVVSSPSTCRVCCEVRRAADGLAAV